MNKWLKNLLVVLAIFSFLYYLILVILDGYFLGITLLWPLIGIICSLLVFLDFKGKLPKINKVFASVIGILILIFGCYACLNLFFILSPKEKIPDDSVDYIILLGGGLKMNGTPSSSVSNRLDICAELWKGLNSNCKIVACGGHIKPAPFAESIMLEKELEKRRISKEFILQEDKSLDTIQNLQNAAILLSQQIGCSLQEILDSKIVIVTSDYHLSRALWIAKRLGYKNTFGFSSKTAKYAILNSYLREILAITKLQLRILFTGKPTMLIVDEKSLQKNQ